ncbi:MAG: hypothetical protein ABJG86_09840 [Nitratireductor sp.]|uniref:hypothetical protein n=1 Tax=Parvibaculum sp. TaxID=2024848 RepID=UPI00328C8D16
MTDDGLRQSAAEVDVLDLAGRIIANPRRTCVSQAGELALANAVEAFWSVALEAECMAKAEALRAGLRRKGLLNLTAEEFDEAARLDSRIAAHVKAIGFAMAVMRNTATEEEN